ncbi:TlyA family RNA methyltransferase [Acidovorax sp. NCPPB 2350]|nr:TlyA family RNA methyltransferase [Acidovorax sp. NCPPB 2350]
MRADVFLVESGHAATRSQAQRLVAAGVQWRFAASMPWQKVAKNGDDIPAGAEVQLLDMAEARYLSRGGLKLEGALRSAGLSVAGWRCLDVGQSTGGFTDCLLQQGAAQVIGVDVGHGQLHERLRSDPRVVCVEGVNARGLTAEGLVQACELALSEPVPEADDDRQPVNPYHWMSGDGEVTDYDDSGDADDSDVDAHLAERAGARPAAPKRRRRRGTAGVDLTPAFDLVAGDVSFISLTLILPAVVPLLKAGGTLLMLVKPQFELQPGQVGKGGIVRDPVLHALVEQRIRESCAALPLRVVGWHDSPIEGGDGNREFFIHARREA